ncbi:MAG: hypothetical protein LBL84_00750 [Candidatus Nomurabacteria bacterium]|jgi:hypothetical protein|nr:hypothetical protein [Candidatus Nomurabacteria bacterium]
MADGGLASGNSARENVDPDFLATTRKAEQEASNATPGYSQAANNNSTIPGFNAAQSAKDGELVGGVPPISFTGTGAGGGKGLGGMSTKALLKKAGPAGGVVGLLFGAMFGINSLTSLMPFHLAANMLDKLNSQDTGIRLRSSALTKRLMGTHRQVATKTGLTGVQRYKNIPQSFEKRLSQNGITVLKDGTNKVTGLEFTEPDGKKTTIPPGDFDDFRSKNTAFNLAYTSAARTKFGSFFDSVANKFFSAFGINRNRYKDWKNTADSAGDQKRLRVDVQEATTGKSKTSSGTAEYKTDVDGKQMMDENGKPIRNPTSTTPENLEIGGGKNSVAGVGENLKAKASSIASAGNLICGALNGIAAVGIISAGIETGRLIALAASFLEAVDKTKAGHGKGAPLHEWGNLLSAEHTRQDAKVASAEEEQAALSAFGGTSGEDYTNEDRSGTAPATDYSTTRTSERKSALEAKGLLWLATGAQVPKNDASTIKFSVESSAGFINNMLTMSLTMRTGCQITSIVSGVIFGILTFFPPGAGAVIKSIGKAAGAVGLGAIIGTALSIIIPAVAQKIAIDYVTDAIGEDLGSALASGGSAEMKMLHQIGGGAPSGETQTATYYRETQKVIAEYAEMERLEKSPFDPTSKYTFVGSIVGKVVPYAQQMSSLSGFFTSVGSVFSQSLTAALPTASAVASVTDIERNKGNCPFLEGIEVQGDAYCRSNMTSDLSTISTPPEDIYDLLAGWGDIQDAYGDNPKIVDRLHNAMWDPTFELSDWNPSLSAYITFCSNRTSPFGQNDTTIPALISGTSTGDSTVDGAIGAVPIIGDIIDVFDGVIGLETQNWATGKICSNTDSNSPMWNSKIKYYNAFIENERVLEIISDGEYKSMVAEYLNTKPVDTGSSTAGYDADAIDKNEIGTDDTKSAIDAYIEDYVAVFGSSAVDQSTVVAYLPPADKPGKLAPVISSTQTKAGLSVPFIRHFSAAPTHTRLIGVTA